MQARRSRYWDIVRTRFFIVVLVLASLSYMIGRRESLKEDNAVDKALSYLFSRDLGYALIGVKPMSCEEWFWYKSVDSQSKEKVLNFLKQNFSDNKKFILYIETSSSAAVNIILIHKPLLTKTIRRERYLRNFIKTQYRSVGNFFRVLNLSKCGISRIFHYDDHALGLAFGYGRENSFYASRRMEIRDFLTYKQKLPGFRLRPTPGGIIRAGRLPPPYVMLPTREVAPSSGFSCLEEELDYLTSLETKMPEFGPPNLFSPPVFITKKCEETDQLVQHYRRSTNKLARLYPQQTFSRPLVEKAARP